MDFDQLMNAFETAADEGRMRTARTLYEEGLSRFPEHTLFFGYNLGALLQIAGGRRRGREGSLRARARGPRAERGLLRAEGLDEIEANICENSMLLSLSFEEYELWASRLEKLQPENPILTEQRPRMRELREQGHPWWTAMLVIAKSGYDADPAKDPGRYAAAAAILQLLLLNRRQLRVPRDEHRFAVISYAALTVQAWSKCGVAMAEARRAEDPRELAVVLDQAVPLVEEFVTANPADTDAQAALDGMREFLAAVTRPRAERAKISWGQVAVYTVALAAAGYFLRDRLGSAWPWVTLVGALIVALLCERVLSRLRVKTEGPAPGWQESAALAEDCRTVGTQRSGAIDRAQWDHYNQTKQTAGGEPHQLTLDEVSVEGPVLILVYRWDEDLIYEEADRLDTRARAYIACAIRDAAIGAGLSCQAGLSHGQRPAWEIASQAIPVSLMAAGFDVGEKVCWMHVGPTMVIEGRLSGSESVAAGLAKGFQSHFEQIRV